MSKVRVRFAPSPTGPLHIGGVRTALYNYLFAKKNKGSFILRIEDTDQNRYVPGAEQYILDSLEWLGLKLDEGPVQGGDFGPYRQSERKHIYKKYVDELIAKGHAYYAFDSNEELEAVRAKFENDSFKYNFETRANLKNSFTMTEEEVSNQLKQGHNVVVRLNIPKDEQISIIDMIRGVVTFNSNELDDKVILKGDGMPTYHLANIVDDHLMEITHVIRGEEWLSSTAHHMLLYRFFNWQAPQFAHLPLILKPTGQGKLSKRDGAKFGFPVFPLTWNGDMQDSEIYPGFKEEGFIEGALLNFLAFLGWSPGTDQEIFSLDELAEAFSIDKIVKSGARFDFDKAKWFNQQYLMAMDNDHLANRIFDQVSKLGYNQDLSYIAKACSMMKERVEKIEDIATKGHYLFTKPIYVDTDTFQKKYKAENKNHLLNMIDAIDPNGDRHSHEEKIKAYITEHSLKMGDIMPILRIGLTGTMQGPDLFDTIALLGKEEVNSRIRTLLNT
jgi:glutamyl-tRNA synthetase